ncbi:AMP-binding protein [Thermoflexibacter ruber]|uniref:AMP-binding protein n=1 Tax=Thermoflexibacter ruber TaxID=1003 RepID=UPI001FEC9899|nr:AMP-binding protein [Thermoflexibacter ruber]
MFLFIEMFIYFHDFCLSFQEVAKLNIAQIENLGKPYLKQTLAFCWEWLQGKELFQLQTSGSTGSPKTIQVARWQMQASASLTAQVLHLQKDDTALVCLNTAYIGGKMMLVRGLEIGMPLLVTEPSANPFQNLKITDKDFQFGQYTFQSLDFIALVPLQLFTILKEEKNKLDSFHKLKIIVGGAPVNAELENLVQMIPNPVYATYGMTETVSHIALRRLNGKERSSYYQVLPQTSIGQDDRECLTIISPVTNFEKVITNDKVRLIDEHTFEWIGRVDNIINSGGIKIQIEKIELEIDKVLAFCQVFRRFVVIGLPDDKLGQSAVLVIEGEPLHQEIENNIYTLLKINLNRYEVPKKIYYLVSFPETPTAKIDRISIGKML